MLDALRQGCHDFRIPIRSVNDPGQGIVHVIGPQLGITQPGMTILCGDSHTSTHGAFGALAFGIGTSQVEHVLATQTISMDRPRSMAVTVNNTLPIGVTAKDLILAVIQKIGAGGAQGHIIEYRGEAIANLSMESRMTVCNMSIEAGARAGMIAPDSVTYDYLAGREHAPRGADWSAAVERWNTLRTDEGATFDSEVVLDGAALSPFVTWGTNPSQAAPLSSQVPDPKTMESRAQQAAAEKALDYMDLTPGTPLTEIAIDIVFLGSCTNGRIEDLRAAAAVLNGRTLAPGTRMLVVPGSTLVKSLAEDEGLDRVFLEAGAEWRDSGCSLCVGMNNDVVEPGQRCASTSNRNFEGRQGPGARTHLVSPTVAASTAVLGHLGSPKQLGA